MQAMFILLCYILIHVFFKKKKIENIIVDTWAECLSYVKGVKNAKYKIVTLNDNKKVLRVEYKEKDKPVVLTGKITFKYIEDSGTTDLLVNKKDPNEFYAFGPSK